VNLTQLKGCIELQGDTKKIEGLTNSEKTIRNWRICNWLEIVLDSVHKDGHDSVLPS